MNGRNQMTPKFWTSVGMHCSHRVAQKYQRNIFCGFSSDVGKGLINGGLVYGVMLAHSYQQQCIGSWKNAAFTQLHTIMRNTSKRTQHKPLILNIIIRSKTFHCQNRLYSACREMIRVQFQGSPCGICDWKIDTGRGYFEARHLSPVRIIPPLLDVYPFIYHRRC